ncbi:TonB-dependent receptor [Pseudoxanthomonas sp.]|uniref:TonB-dependent receptor n=1 Tax=Pseudoxanthomonas sp. TaxID=1871049 RepID=UPI002601E4A6|nr:TonB-dependent receptor [Pseudoxanthomonas sp.]WDS35037.1 MAG: TonB-dependent receptor [Pseudoxanthomonas sp.]
MSGYHRCTPAPTRRHLPLAIMACLALPVLAHAQDEVSSKTKTLDEVVVTAQKRSERLQDTPVSAAVVSQQALEDANASDISDLNKLVPSVQLKGTNNGRVPIAMRGISTNADETTVGLTSGVLIMIDGVPVSSDAAGVNELSDLASVEVLKGPQSTLGGRAASAGVINLVTRKPTDYWSGAFSAMGTNDGENKVDAFLSGPISEGASFSLSAYNHHVVLPIHNIATSKDSTTDSDGARLKLLLRPSDNVDVTLAAHGYKIDARGGSFTYQYLTQQDIFSGRLPVTADSAAYSAVMAGVTPHWGNTDYNSPVDMRAQTSGSDFSANVDWRLGDYTISSTTAYQRERQHMVQDAGAVATYWEDGLTDAMCDLTGAAAFCAASWDNAQHIILKPTTKSQEFKIASPLDGPVSFVAGVFYSETDVWSSGLRTMFFNPYDYVVDSNTKTLDAYGRFTWKLPGDFDLLTGLRFNHDKVSYWKYGSYDNQATYYYSSNEASENTWVGDLTLRKHFTPDAMGYLTLARGYKPMAFNTAAALSSNDALDPVDNETVDNIELGLKLSLLDRSLTIDSALFQTTYRDYQVQTYETSNGYLADLHLSSAGKARTRGVESDVKWAASEALRVTGSLAWIQAKFVDFQGAPCWGGNTSQTEAEGCVDGTYQDLSGKSMPDAPKFKANVGVDYTWFGNNAKRPDLTLSGQYAWRSGTYMQADNNPYTWQPAFGLFNLSLTGKWNNGKFTASLFVNNVFDKFYLVNVTDNFSGIWSDSAIAITGQPARDSSRYAGVRLNWNFD